MAVATIGLIGLTACTSDPSPKRVAEDLVKTLAETEQEEECMLGVIDGYSSDELRELGEAVNEGNLDAVAELGQYQADLEACME